MSRSLFMLAVSLLGPGAALVPALVPPASAEVPPPAPVAAWLAAVDARLSPAWRGSFLQDCETRLPPGHALSDRALSVTVQVAVGPDGRLAEVWPVDPGHPVFDQGAVEVVQASQPWPAPPAEALSDDGRAHLQRVFLRDPERAGASALVVVRWPAERAVPALLARRQGAAALARLAADEALGDRARLSLARAVAVALVLEGLPQAGPAGLAAAAAADDPRVRLALEDALAQATGPARRAVFAALAAGAGPDPTGALAAGLADPAVTSLAAAGLARRGAGAQVFAALAPWLADPARRLAALEALEAVGAPESGPALLRWLSEGAVAERSAAARALGAVVAGAEGPATAGLRRALEDPAGAVRAAALQGLARAGAGGLQSKSLFYRVIPAVRDPEPAARAAALEAMAALGGPRAEADLVLLSRKARHPLERATAVAALARLPGEAATARLAQLAAGPEPVGSLALAAWAARAPAAALQALERLPEDRRAALLPARFQAVLAAEGAAAAVRFFADAVAATQSPAVRARIIEAWLRAQPTASSVRMARGGGASG